MPKESMLVLAVMTAVVMLLIGARVAYDDVLGLIDSPDPEQTARGEAALGELRRFAQSNLPLDLIAAIAPCQAERNYEDVCLTVAPGWSLAPNRQQAASDLWSAWAGICTQHGLAEEPSDCRIELRSGAGDRLGGSSDDDGSRIWVRE